MQQQQQHMLGLAQFEQPRSKRQFAAQVKTLSRGNRQFFRQRGFAAWMDNQPEPSSPRAQNLLPGNAQRLRKDRAQALVPLHHIAQRRLQYSPIEPSRESQY